MAEKGSRRPDREPTLELPALFGRRRRRDQAPVDESPSPQESDTPANEEAASTGEQEPPRPEPEPSFAPAPAHSPAAPAPAERGVDVRPERETSDVPEPATSAAEDRGQRRAPRTGPLLPPWAAVLLAGLIVGVLGTALTYAGLRGCEVVRGTDSCGGPGVGLLLVIVVAMVLAGSVTLKLVGVADSSGLSFLGVGLTCVVVLVALLQSVFSAWMFVAVPVIAGVSFLVARWVTTRLIEPVDEGPTVDIR